MIKQKKAGLELMSFWLFFAFGIILLTLLVGVYFFYDYKGDLRSIEVNILFQRLTNCLKTNNFDKNFDIFFECNLNKKIIQDSGNYFIKISSGEIVIQEGIDNFETLCGLQDKNSDFPRCKETSFFLNSKNVKILVASNNLGGLV